MMKTFCASALALVFSLVVAGCSREAAPPVVNTESSTAEATQEAEQGAAADNRVATTEGGDASRAESAAGSWPDRKNLPNDLSPFEGKIGKTY